MKIRFSFGWIQGPAGRSAFKDKNAFALFEEYLKRISRFSSFEVGRWNDARPSKEGTKKIWFCERKGKEISSEELSSKLAQILNDGVKELEIVIGGPDGLDKTEIEKANPDFLWSFGPLTLPHELAAVVASEQIYRAWSILRNLPYHNTH
ncbi:MAG: 23S rRNA (pseudouridine(1915)-N(3))-methyltransferase RlmH [Candidatus Omnitrophica bacterium]|nr:23S rRNA (pseudouridine(1915)-N(3))-methyltransferase RlmH [Candidatus Omnitrophota bacterium]